MKKTIPSLLEEMSRITSTCEIILVNNGSTDRTQEVIESLCKYDTRIVSSRVPVNIGYGFGVLTGYKAARGIFVGHIPADGPVSATEVARLAQMVLEVGPGCLVSAIRTQRRETILRRFVSQLYNLLFYLLFGPLAKDINGTPKFIHSVDFQRLALTSTDYFLEAEMMIRATQLGLVTHRVSVESQARPGGVSKVSSHLIPCCLEFLKNMVRFRLNLTFKTFPQSPQVFSPSRRGNSTLSDYPGD